MRRFCSLTAARPAWRRTGRPAGRWPRAAPAVLGVLVWLAGCAEPTPDWRDPKAGPVKSNIVRVNKFFSVNPWLSFGEEAAGRVNGIAFTVYLEDAEEPKGVFGNGVIVVEMYRLDRDARGRENPVHLQTWELPPDKAYPWRAKNMTSFGWGYGLRLPWDKNLNVDGQVVAFIIKYIRDDGRVVTSSRKVLKVPPPGGDHRGASLVQRS